MHTRETMRRRIKFERQGVINRLDQLNSMLRDQSKLASVDKAVIAMMHQQAAIMRQYIDVLTNQLQLVSDVYDVY
jgi:hypothetical protein